MVTGYGVPLEGWAGAVSVPLKVEVEPVPGVRVKGPVVTPLTCAVAMQRLECASVHEQALLRRSRILQQHLSGHLTTLHCAQLHDRPSTACLQHNKCAAQ
jgi:hypothetical protein